ncbi:hypothetical protein Tco_0251837 [Tanacetum coccineum]
MTLDIHNWSSSVHQEILKVVKDEILHIINQVDARALELEIERLLRAVVSYNIMSIVQNNSVVDTSNLQTELEQLEFQVRNYEKEIAHLKTTYKNLFDSISVTRAQTKTIIDSLQNKLHDTIYENAKLRAQLFDKVSDQKDTNKGMSANTKFAKQSILGKPPSASRPKLYAVPPLPNSTAFPKVGETNALSKPVTSNSVPSSRESNVVKNERVIAPGIFRINPFKANRYVNGHVILDMKIPKVPLFQKWQIKRTHKAQVWKPKNVGSKERFASPKPSKPRSCLRWSPTGRFFDLKGKIIASSKSESQSDCSKGDNACTSNPQEPINKRFPVSLFYDRLSNWFDTCYFIALLSNNLKDKEDHGVIECALEGVFFNNNPFFKEKENVRVNCNPFFKEKGSVRFSALYLKKKRNLLVFTSVDMIVMTSMVELESLFGHLFDELSNGENQVVSKSSAVTTADASDKLQQIKIQLHLLQL